MSSTTQAPAVRMTRIANPASIPSPIHRVLSTTISVTRPTRSNSAATPLRMPPSGPFAVITWPRLGAPATSNGPAMTAGTASTAPIQNFALLDMPEGGGWSGGRLYGDSPGGPGGPPYGGGGGCWDTWLRLAQVRVR